MSGIAFVQVGFVHGGYVRQGFCPTLKSVLVEDYPPVL